MENSEDDRVPEHTMEWPFPGQDLRGLSVL